MSNMKHINNYTNVMAGWSKALGAKPTEAQLSLAHVFGRPGKQSLAVAMALRDSGVTGKQMLAASALFDGRPTPQRNHLRGLVSDGTFTRLPVPGAYAVALSDKGKSWVALHSGEAAAKLALKPASEPAPKAKAVKAKAEKPASKPRKAKVTVAVTEAPDTAVTAPVEMPAPDMQPSA
jgi:hypothetical protein